MADRFCKNPFTGQKYLSEAQCIRQIEKEHSAELDKLGVSAKQAIFNSRRGYPIGQRHGRSVLSGRDTLWNERAGRYERFADDGERKKYREIFLERMRRVHGKDHLLDDPDQQRKMLASRSIAGQYRFQDGSTKEYVGQEELAFLRFLDDALGWPGTDVHAPAPQNFPYRGDDGREHVYIPDFYIESLNLIVEVKGELHNGFRSRDIRIENAKDGVLKTSGYTYVKVEDRDYGDFMDALVSAKRRCEESEDV